MSTVVLAAYGYGIRYNHGLFRQTFEDGWQTEEAEDWLRQVHPWEFERPETNYRISFGGEVTTENGALAWHPSETVLAVGYDRSEEHTSELQSLMRSSYAVFCLKKKQMKTI